MATVAEGLVEALTGALAEKKARIETATSAGCDTSGLKRQVAQIESDLAAAKRRVIEEFHQVPTIHTRDGMGWKGEGRSRGRPLPFARSLKTRTAGRASRATDRAGTKTLTLDSIPAHEQNAALCCATPPAGTDTRRRRTLREMFLADKKDLIFRCAGAHKPRQPRSAHVQKHAVNAA